MHFLASHRQCSDISVSVVLILEDDYDFDEHADPDAQPEKLDSDSSEDDVDEESVDGAKRAQGSGSASLPTKKERHPRKRSFPNITFDKFLPGAHSVSRKVFC